jgi:short-subunit dehydrogenase
MAKTALITGASSGIGYELSKRFAAEGYHLVLVARDGQRLNQLAADLDRVHDTESLVLIQDLSDPASPQSIFAALKRDGITIDVLVNNAGTQVYGEFAEVELDRLLAMIQVNLTALTHLTGLLLPQMVERGSGKILNVASTGAYVPSPLNAVYCATKAYVLSFSEGLAAELSGTGVTVATLCPGATDTAFVTRHGLQDVRLFRHTMTPSQVADIGYRTLMRGRHVTVAGLGNQLMVVAFQLMAPFLPLIPPAALNRVGAFIMGRSSGSPHSQARRHDYHYDDTVQQTGH